MRIDLGKALKKLKGVKLLSLLLLLLMLASTVAGFVLQAFNWRRQTNDGQEIELPDTNIIDYVLTAEQKDYLIRQGRTIIEYRYRLACQDCANQRIYLESAAGEFSDQIFLQEIVDDTVTNSTLEISSFYGRRSLANPSNDDILNALCAIMADPPVRCVTRNV